MKIIYFVNLYPAVSHTFIRREIHALERDGHTVHRIAIRRHDRVVDPRDKDEFDRTDELTTMPKANILAILIGTAVKKPARFFGTLWFALGCAHRSGIHLTKMAAYFAEAAILARYCQKRRAEHVRVHFGTNGATIVRLARRLGAPPYSVAYHGPDEFDAPMKWDIGGVVAESAFCSAISSFCSAQLKRWSDPIHWGKVRIVPCAIEESFLKPSPMPPDETRTLCMVARLSAQKGLHLLIEAFARSSHDHPQIRIEIVGDGEMRPQLENAIAKHGLAERVRLHGALPGEQVREVIAASHAMVLPSFAEGLPVVLMEAMGVGRPVITTYVAGIPELVEDGRNGWIVPAGDTEALARAIGRFAETSAGSLAEMGIRANQDVVRDHHIERVYERLIEAIQQSRDI